MFGRIGSLATFFPLLLAGFLAGMTYWLELATRPPMTGQDGKMRHDPDYIVENFQVRRFDPEGALQHTLHAKKMQHYPDDDSTWVLGPNLTYHRAPPTTVTSLEAKIDGKGTHIELIGDVVVTRGAVDGKPPTSLMTAHLDAYPDDEVAISKVPVTITQGLTKVEGSGLKANNATAIYMLDGPVRGIFHKNRTGPRRGQDGLDADAKVSTPPVQAPTTKSRIKPKPKVAPKKRVAVQTSSKPSPRR